MNFVRMGCALALVAGLTAPGEAQQKTAPQPAKPTAPTRGATGGRASRPAATGPLAGRAVTTTSGLTMVVTQRGTGRRPKPGETVLVHYTGTLTDGTKFDSSHDRNEAIAFPIGRGAVIKGWDEGISRLGIGDRAVLIIPPRLGYGAEGAGGGIIPPNATLVFVVTLVDIRPDAQ